MVPPQESVMWPLEVGPQLGTVLEGRRAKVTELCCCDCIMFTVWCPCNEPQGALYSVWTLRRLRTLTGLLAARGHCCVVLFCVVSCCIVVTPCGPKNLYAQLSSTNRLWLSAEACSPGLEPGTFSTRNVHYQENPKPGTINTKSLQHQGPSAPGTFTIKNLKHKDPWVSRKFRTRNLQHQEPFWQEADAPAVSPSDSGGCWPETLSEAPTSATFTWFLVGPQEPERGTLVKQQ